MAELQVHPFIGTNTNKDTFDPSRTRVGRVGTSTVWLSIWFGDLEFTIFGTPNELVELTRHLHELAVNARDAEHEEILNDFDEQDRQLTAVDSDEEPPNNWPDTGIVNHRVEDMGEDPFKYEHRSDP